MPLSLNNRLRYYLLRSVSYKKLHMQMIGTLWCCVIRNTYHADISGYKHSGAKLLVLIQIQTWHGIPSLTLSVHRNATVMPLVDPVYTGIQPGDPANSVRYTGTPLENLVETAPHSNSTAETGYYSLRWNTIGCTLTAYTHSSSYS